MEWKTVMILVVVLLVCSLTPAAAVNINETTKAGNIEETLKKTGTALKTHDMVKLMVQLPHLVKQLKEIEESLKHAPCLESTTNMTQSNSNSNDNVLDADRMAKSLNGKYGNNKLSITCLHDVNITDLKRGDIIQVKNNNGYIRYLEFNGRLNNSGVFTRNVIREEIKEGYEAPDAEKLVSYILQLQKIDLDKRRLKAEKILEKGYAQTKASFESICIYLFKYSHIEIWGSAISGLLILFLLGLSQRIFEAIPKHPIGFCITISLIAVVIGLICGIIVIIAECIKKIGKNNIKKANFDLAIIKPEEEDLLHYQNVT